MANEVAAAWNEADGWYGKLDTRWQPRPAAHVFALFNTHLAGPIATSTSSMPERSRRMSPATTNQPSVKPGST